MSLLYCKIYGSSILEFKDESIGRTQYANITMYDKCKIFWIIDHERYTHDNNIIRYHGSIMTMTLETQARFQRSNITLLDKNTKLNIAME